MPYAPETVVVEAYTIRLVPDVLAVAPGGGGRVTARIRVKLGESA
ncbi:MAG TPA: hypothetical protein VMA73_20340 [Streptosporangiaceae bacterium]|nr:hypothetical protein [Streptosporangiaceae bacterium]